MRTAVGTIATLLVAAIAPYGAVADPVAPGGWAASGLFLVYADDTSVCFHGATDLFVGSVTSNNLGPVSGIDIVLVSQGAPASGDHVRVSSVNGQTEGTLSSQTCGQGTVSSVSVYSVCVAGQDLVQLGTSFGVVQIYIGPSPPNQCHAVAASIDLAPGDAIQTVTVPLAVPALPPATVIGYVGTVVVQFSTGTSATVLAAGAMNPPCDAFDPGTNPLVVSCVANPVLCCTPIMAQFPPSLDLDGLDVACLREASAEIDLDGDGVSDFSQTGLRTITSGPCP